VATSAGKYGESLNKSAEKNAKHYFAQEILSA